MKAIKPGVIPRGSRPAVVPARRSYCPLRKHKVLEGQDDRERAEPVGDDEQEEGQALEDSEASDRHDVQRDGGVDRGPDQGPDPALDRLPALAQHLNRQSERVVVWNVVGNDTQDQEQEEMSAQTVPSGFTARERTSVPTAVLCQVVRRTPSTCKRTQAANSPMKVHQKILRAGTDFRT